MTAEYTLIYLFSNAFIRDYSIEYSEYETNVFFF